MVPFAIPIGLVFIRLMPALALTHMSSIEHQEVGRLMVPRMEVAVWNLNLTRAFFSPSYRLRESAYVL